MVLKQELRGTGAVEHDFSIILAEYAESIQRCGSNLHSKSNSPWRVQDQVRDHSPSDLRHLVSCHLRSLEDIHFLKVYLRHKEHMFHQNDDRSAVIVDNTDTQ